MPFSGRRARRWRRRGRMQIVRRAKDPPRSRSVAPSPSSVAANISTFCAFSMGCRQENFPCRPLRAPRAPMAAPRAHANPAASEEPPRPRLVAPSPSSAIEKISTFCAFSMRCMQENFASPFRSRDPRRRVRRSAGVAGTSRAAVFASSRAVAVDGAAGQRSPVLVGNARRAFTHRPPLRQGDAVRRLSAEADADRVASKRKCMNYLQTEPGRRNTMTWIVIYGMINVINSEKDN